MSRFGAPGAALLSTEAFDERQVPRLLHLRGRSSSSCARRQRDLGVAQTRVRSCSSRTALARARRHLAGVDPVRDPVVRRLPGEQSTTASTASVWYCWTLNWSFIGLRSPSRRSRATARAKICSALIRAASEAKPESRKTARSGCRLAIARTTASVDVVVEARDQRAVVDDEDLVPLDLLDRDRQRQVQPPVEQHLEQQVLARAIGLHAVRRDRRARLLIGLVRRSAARRPCWSCRP